MEETKLKKRRKGESYEEFLDRCEEGELKELEDSWEEDRGENKEREEARKDAKAEREERKLALLEDREKRKREQEEAARKEKERKKRRERAARFAEGVVKLASPGVSKKTRDLLYFGRVRPGFYTQMTPAGEALKPRMTPAGKTHTVGMSPAGQAHKLDLSRLRNVDREVYMEIKRNGDHDTSSHIHKEVGDLGFGGREISSALARLRGLGLITKSGRTWGGEAEYDIVGGE